MLGNRGDTGGQTTCQSIEDVVDRRGTDVLGGEDFGVIGIEGKGLLPMLFFPKPIEALDGRVAVSAILPFAGRAPSELRRSWSFVRASRAATSASTFTPLLTPLVGSAIVPSIGSSERFLL